MIAGRPEAADVDIMLVRSSHARGRARVTHAVVVIFLEFFAWGLLTTPTLTVLHETFPQHTFLMNGLVQGVKGFLSFLSAPVIGALSDIWGRKCFLLMTVFFTCAPIPFMRISPWWYFALISVSGMFAVTFSVVFAYVADVTDQRQRSTAYGSVSARRFVPARSARLTRASSGVGDVRRQPGDEPRHRGVPVGALRGQPGGAGRHGDLGGRHRLRLLRGARVSARQNAADQLGLPALVGTGGPLCLAAPRGHRLHRHADLRHRLPVVPARGRPVLQLLPLPQTGGRLFSRRHRRLHRHGGHPVHHCADACSERADADVGQQEDGPAGSHLPAPAAGLVRLRFRALDDVGGGHGGGHVVHHLPGGLGVGFPQRRPGPARCGPGHDHGHPGPLQRLGPRPVRLHLLPLQRGAQRHSVFTSARHATCSEVERSRAAVPVRRLRRGLRARRRRLHRRAAAGRRRRDVLGQEARRRGPAGRRPADHARQRRRRHRAAPTGQQHVIGRGAARSQQNVPILLFFLHIQEVQASWLP
ncbi:uncharacterized protein mfsd14bb isoform X1 [Syngnathoides biaculeatus]|uniref:uncharacterized protein mfsd14bb isoform X1 n=1 Tax=Syngnathoides biaculeatus TaxID=300417 RepID=UPI002ADE401A|nr:uncharacterized protein mfsd14bb isoform X1 [Syngnathoides biaculeatus]